MIEVALTKGKVALIDDCDARFAEHKWYAREEPPGSGNFYATRAVFRVGGKGAKYEVTLHREIMSRPAVKIDHRNGNTLDNRRANLRLAPGGGNQQNSKRPRHNTSGFKGVCLHQQTGRWMAYIKCNGKRIYLGLHVTRQAAARAYDAAARQLHGEFARPNFQE